MEHKIYYDMGINEDTGKFTLRFSNDGVRYAYVEFDTSEELLGFQENLNQAVAIYLVNNNAN